MTVIAETNIRKCENCEKGTFHGVNEPQGSEAAHALIIYT